MPASFSLQKLGVFDAYDVQYRGYIERFVSPHYRFVRLEITPSAKFALLSDQPLDLKLPAMIRGEAPTEADIELLVSFRPEYGWRRGYGCADFAIEKNSVGDLVWFRKPVKNCIGLGRCLERQDAHYAKIKQARLEAMRARKPLPPDPAYSEKEESCEQ